MFMQDIHEGVLVKDMSSTGLGLLTVEWLTYILSPLVLCLYPAQYCILFQRGKFRKDVLGFVLSQCCPFDIYV